MVYMAERQVNDLLDFYAIQPPAQQRRRHSTRDGGPAAGLSLEDKMKVVKRHLGVRGLQVRRETSFA